MLCLQQLLHQHGFLPRRSCPSSLVYSTSNYKRILKDHQTVDVVFFDFRKAFDQVNHTLLLQKLKGFGVPLQYVSWFQSFLKDRTFSVMVNGSIDSIISPIPSGVPQGTVAGPLLFLIFINDLLLSLPSSIHFAAFADDIKLYSHDSILLQSGIDIVSEWASANSLPLAHTKTTLLRLGAKNPGHHYHLDSIPITESAVVRDLGLLTDSHLKFDSHIAKTSSLAILRCSQLLKSFRSRSLPLYKHLFNTYVLPVLEYCSAVYSPSPSSTLSHKLEKPLRSFTRKVLQRCNIRYTSYLNRLEILDLYSLRHRRLKSQLILLYKIICGATFFPEIHSYVRLSNSNRRPMTLICIRPQVNDFFSSTVPIWNSITSNCPEFLSPGKFISLLEQSINRL
ncbi:hypothetical protein CRE_24195 [Caenorhabditis remanei]|uniref:Reverse transcriptase domain-containing protein n=1 Tax=Caenorhabditis remanei TaxID=31234 RepID=E3N997_CAERE|nr:hypothetical protein CRE_24195 [Caenorhabditis remanei]